VLWGILGIPVAFVMYVVSVALMFPVGGGIAHIMFAYSDGGNLGGARVVFVGHCIAAILVTGFLRWTRYPMPWYWVAFVVSLIGLWLWLPAPMSSSASDEFRRQGLLLTPLLPIVAYAAARVRLRRRSSANRAT
jgi:hypothetical protein